jgi:hypothetical protein
MLKKTYALYQKPISVSNAKFTVIGFVRYKVQAKTYSRLTIEVTSFDRMAEVKKEFFVFFMDNLKEFVDKFVEKGHLVNVCGDLVISSKSKADMQMIVLLGLHLSLFRDAVNAFEGVEPGTKQISTEELDNKDEIAF